MSCNEQYEAETYESSLQNYFFFNMTYLDWDIIWSDSVYEMEGLSSKSLLSYFCYYVIIKIIDSWFKWRRFCIYFCSYILQFWLWLWWLGTFDYDTPLVVSLIVCYWKFEFRCVEANCIYAPYFPKYRNIPQFLTTFGTVNNGS